MNNVFGSEYSAAYNALYSDKDYKAECGTIQQLIHKYGRPGTQSILDLGCGTGGHSHLLAESGFEILGVDRSEFMLNQARSQNSGAQFTQGDLTRFRGSKKYDAVLLMFGVLSYQTTDEAVLAAFTTARENLLPGGLLIFDVWYGPAVVSQKPSSRVKTVTDSEGRMVVRKVQTEMSPTGHCCLVHYDLECSKDGALKYSTQETHTMRYFFPQELEAFLNKSQFELVHFSDIENLQNPPSAETWNVIQAARLK